VGANKSKAARHQDNLIKGGRVRYLGIQTTLMSYGTGLAVSPAAHCCSHCACSMEWKRRRTRDIPTAPVAQKNFIDFFESVCACRHVDFSGVYVHWGLATFDICMQNTKTTTRAAAVSVSVAESVSESVSDCHECSCRLSSDDSHDCQTAVNDIMILYTSICTGPVAARWAANTPAPDQMWRKPRFALASRPIIL